MSSPIFSPLRNSRPFSPLSGSKTTVEDTLLSSSRQIQKNLEKERVSKEHELLRNRHLEESRLVSHGRELDAMAAAKKEAALRLHAVEHASAATRERDTATLQVRRALERIKRLEEERAATKALLMELSKANESRDTELRVLHGALRESEGRCKHLTEDNARLTEENIKLLKTADAARAVARQSHEVAALAEDERDTLTLANSRLKALLLRTHQTALAQGVILPSTVLGSSSSGGGGSGGTGE